MRVLFLSDYVSIHQKAFCDAMYDALKEKFTFMATTRVSEARKQMGWSDYTAQVPYAVYNTDFSNGEIEKFVDGFDFIILGSSHEKRVNGVLRKKLVFYYQERPLKKGMKELLKPKRAWAILRMILRQTKKTHLLAASAYCYVDYNKLGCFKNRAWKWGYFIKPICEFYNPREGQVAKILWVGRMIAWKHCEMMIESARVLHRKGYEFQLDLIGGGEEEDKLKDIVKECGLTEKVNFLGKKSNEEVREYMKKSDIFVTTSDKREGWGVVINEAMSAGCCVVASDAMGAAPYLIRHQINGLLYESENQHQLNDVLEGAIENKGLREKLGKAALDTMNHTWSPGNAAKRVIALGEHLLDGGREECDGENKNSPCSRASSEISY